MTATIHLIEGTQGRVALLACPAVSFPRVTEGDQVTSTIHFVERSQVQEDPTSKAVSVFTSVANASYQCAIKRVKWR